jgi:hypothetical protein
MMVVFSEFIKEIVEVFMDDFPFMGRRSWIAWQAWIRSSRGVQR